MSDNKRPVAVDVFSLQRAVMEDSRRPCLFGVSGPCFHPKCLEAHYETLRIERRAYNAALDGDDNPSVTEHECFDEHHDIDEGDK